MRSWYLSHRRTAKAQAHARLEERKLQNAKVPFLMSQLNFKSSIEGRGGGGGGGLRNTDH